MFESKDCFLDFHNTSSIDQLHVFWITFENKHDKDVKTQQGKIHQ